MCYLIFLPKKLNLKYLLFQFYYYLIIISILIMFYINFSIVIILFLKLLKKYILELNIIKINIFL